MDFLCGLKKNTHNIQLLLLYFELSAVVSRLTIQNGNYFSLTNVWVRPALTEAGFWVRRLVIMWIITNKEDKQIHDGKIVHLKGKKINQQLN
jgi:hypothetical protein